MAALKLILDTRTTKKDGTYPVKLYGYHKGQFYINFDISVTAEQWDGKQITDHQKARTYNKIIKTKLIQSENTILQLSSSGKLSKLTTAELKNILETGATTEPEIETACTEIYLLADHLSRYIQNCKAQGTKEIYARTLFRINQFSANVSFAGVNIIWLKSFDGFLEASGCETNTRAIHMRNIRAVYNDAINEDRISLNLYPFRKFKIRKEATQKRAITLEQLKEFRDFEVQKYQEKYRDLWMLTFYLIGINPTDLLNLRHGDYREGRIRYTRAKTGRLYNIEVLPEAAQIIERYRGKDYLLNVLDENIGCKDFISRWDKNLKKIGRLEWVANSAKDKKRIKKNKKKIVPLLPELTIYSARHTWATLAIKLKISKDDVAAALGHGGNTVTDVYIDFDPEEVDKANQTLLKALQ